MVRPSDNRRLLLLAGLVLSLLAGAAVAALASGLWLSYRAADYPGAMRVSDHSHYRAVPTLSFRRDTTYRTSDPFPLVYNWYSQTFALGPEAHAQSACIVMERTSRRWVVQSTVGVTVCDTPSGRMVFVQRSFVLRYPDL